MEKASRSCPKCKTALEIAIHEEVEVDTCPSCQGIWVGHMNEKQVLQIKPQTFTMDELQRLRSLYEPYAKRDPVSYVPCPDCEGLMQRKNWGSHSGVIVDTCKDHGTWYDAGEVEKIQDFIAHGGIEYEKMKAVRKTEVRLETKLNTEVLRLDKKADSIYRRARIFSLLGF